MKELGERLVDVHSQHQNLLLNKQDFQLGVVDIFSDDEKELAQYQQSFRQYQQLKQSLDDLKESIERNRQNADFLRFQCDELTQANLVEGEQEELEQRSDTMSHSEDIKRALYEADNALGAEQTGVVSALRSTLYELRKIGDVYPVAAELVERVDSCYIELKDIAQEVSSHLERIDFDPMEMDAVTNRLDKLYDLEKKYHVETVEELIAKRAELSEQLDNIENSDEALSALQQQLQQLHKQACQEADALTRLRAKAAKRIESEMQQKLVPLGMPHVRFSVEISPEPLGLSGQDKIAFMFSAKF